MDVATLREAMGRTLSLERYAELVPAVNTALRMADCTTINRAAMWCAQVGHESLGLRYQQEIWGPTAQQKKYDPASGSSLARTLGNTVAGDGSRFRGHGWLQITGRGHHASVSKWAHGKGYVPTATYFVDRPEELGSDRYAGLAVAWYWTVARPDINTLSDRGDLETVTRRINGGTTGLADRQARWDRCRKLGAALLPAAAHRAPEEDDMPSPADLWQHPIDDPYSPQVGDTQPAHVILAFLGANAAHAANASRAALTELAGLRVAVDRLANAVGTGQGVDPAALQAAVRDGVAQALAESVRVTGSLDVAPR